jgi:uncharacterized coiled-coil protein SlyX
MAMNLLVLGIDTSALEEALGAQESTLRKLNERFFKDLTLAHIQQDELRAKLKEKEQAIWISKTEDHSSDAPPSTHTVNGVLGGA